ncbi:50S ribosomal protein L23 [Waddlia chondrophila 2032/99]|uniref:Large ribosomal subunit protein uL23 n=2 Tax=Waddlia chondrophila TaxID=71667 RepID=D6YS04_WADCW|nr:50S ribosomal protein L23 [Waddlia chondrophila]ADI38849.1 50S ribosomal protein L23 [Waddlia chondrophila WSU 86-1044]CCB90377.1 50S ribosomal protein L23 [Waddlia chondrophila 2032/99]
MQKKDPYQVVKSIHVTEKAMTLQQLVNNDSNRCVQRCESPKYVFVVDKRANKNEIAEAVEQIYKENNIKVVSVNTINLKPKKRRVRGRAGFRPGIKKAIVTLEKGDTIENI